MAAGTVGDFKIYDEQVQAGFWEAVQQTIDIFNANSAGTIILENFDHKGYFIKDAFDQLVDAVRIRTLSSVADISDTKITQAELIGTKVNWALGPVAMTRDSYMKAGRNPEEFSFTLGQQLGQLIPQFQVNAACAALFGSVTVSAAAFTAAVYDQGALSAPKTPASYKGLVAAMALLGDKMNNIAAWLMDGATYAALVGDALANYVVSNVAGSVIASGSPGTLGRPVIITDSAYLKVNPASTLSDRSLIYGLVPGAVRVRISEQPITLVTPILGKANIIYRWQSEGTFTLNVRGAQWATATGHNPALSDLAADNWVQVAASVKGGPGVVAKVKANF